MTTPDPDDPTDGSRPGDSRAGDRGEGTSGSSDGRSSESPVAGRAGMPSDVDAAFAAIIADWAAAGAPHWPDTDAGRDPGREGRDEQDDDGPSSGVGTATPPSGWRPETRPEPEPDPPPAPREPGPPPAGHRPYRAEPPEEEFVPPDVPPLPRLGVSAIAGLLLLIVGVVLLAVPGMLGGPIGLGIVPGLLAMTAGLGWLVFGLRRSNEDDDQDPEDGAVL